MQDTEELKPASTNGVPDPEAAQPSGENESGAGDTQGAAEAATTETPAEPTTEPAADPVTETKKDKKEKSKKKWSFRSISFSKKDKSKPNQAEKSDNTELLEEVRFLFYFLASIANKLG